MHTWIANVFTHKYNQEIQRWAIWEFLALLKELYLYSCHYIRRLFIALSGMVYNVEILKSHLEYYPEIRLQHCRPHPKSGMTKDIFAIVMAQGTSDFAIFCRSRQIQESTLECLWTSAQDIWTVFHRHEDAVPTPLEGSGADGGKPSPTQPNQTQSCLTLISKWRGRIDPNLASQCWGQLWKPHLSCSGDVTTQLNHEW